MLAVQIQEPRPLTILPGLSTQPRSHPPAGLPVWDMIRFPWLKLRNGAFSVIHAVNLPHFIRRWARAGNVWMGSVRP